MRVNRSRGLLAGGRSASGCAGRYYRPAEIRRDWVVERFDNLVGTEARRVAPGDDPDRDAGDSR